MVYLEQSRDNVIDRQRFPQQSLSQGTNRILAGLILIVCLDCSVLRASDLW